MGLLLQVCVVLSIVLLQPTESIFRYIEYIEGQDNLIISAPHGGAEKPEEIPDRKGGCYVEGKCIYSHDCGVADPVNCRVTDYADSYTLEITKAVVEHLNEEWDVYPHVIINHLHRSKLDANRNKEQAAFGDPTAEKAWEEYHYYINQSKKIIGGHALYIDMHGVKTHPEEWIELGYVIKNTELDYGNYTYRDSSIRYLAEVLERTAKDDFDWVLNGEGSMGWMFQQIGHKVIPSPQYPTPNGRGYFRGGYNTQVHGSKDGGVIDAIQIELPLRLRNEEQCKTVCPEVAKVLHDYMEMYYSVGSRVAMSLAMLLLGNVWFISSVY